MNSTNLEYLYAKLMGPILNTLFIEMLVLGVFFVLYSYVRVVIKYPKMLASPHFIIRVWLLGIIVFFNIFVAVSYFLDYSHVSLEDLIVTLRNLSDADYTRAKVIFFTMAPFDMVAIALCISMYAVVSLSDDLKSTENEFIRNDTRRTVRKLLLITSLYHFISILWWTNLGIWTIHGLLLSDIGYHVLYTVIYLIGYLLARRVREGRLIDIALVSYYSIAMLSVYILRTTIFMDRLFRV